MSHYENPDDLEIITLDNALFLQMKNDVAFLINTTEMCLIEHSSTVCLNYPLRSLLYLAREYEVILEQRNENILKYGLVKIPTPACIVLYNGMEKRPEVEILKLSDAFENQEVEPCLELFVKVLNINDGMNENVLNGCKTLKDYVILISDCRQSGARTVVLAPFFSVCSNCSPKMIKKSILSSLSYRFFEASLLVFLDSCRQR